MERKRAISVSILVLVSLIALSGCRCDSQLDNPTKTLNVSVEQQIKGFDPAQVRDEYSQLALTQVYQPLYQFSYLKRPYQVEPLLAQAMPEISKDQKTYTIRLRPDVFFHADPAFKGQKRKLSAADVIYSFERILDPKTKSPNRWLLEGHIKELKAPNDQTVVIELTRPYKQLLYALAMPPLSIVASEVVEEYGPEFLTHPVGTGPFVLKKWIRGQKLVFEKNPNYWNDLHPTTRKPMPLMDKLVVSTFIETQPRWLNFLKGNLDYTTVPKEAFDQVFDSKGNTAAKLKAKQIAVSRTPKADFVYLVFNMDDPIIGKNVFLRQAISAVIDRKERIELFYKGRATIAHGPIPPGIYGHKSDDVDPNGYNLKRANELIRKARAEYHRQGGRGEIPPLLYNMMNSVTDRQIAEIFAQELAHIGLKLKFNVGTWPQFRSRISKGQYQVAIQSWFADYPDPENFLQLLYSKNRSPGPNAANFANPKYDHLYEQMRNMKDGPNRAKIVAKMIQIIRDEAPWAFVVHRMMLTVRHGWLKSYQFHAMDLGPFKYLDIDRAQKTRLLSVLK